ncbi:Glutamine synthetase leaf isozyme, chloroplastic [Glycine soja]|uniref:Glutamate--ammonia ligase n=1 Tax=Glycine soja TaxID=3848 RepID=A0A0B2RC08_GLYSO|nr:Glutamine synthetase leaf isozyme, chloroplastic [Glycine soja]
MRELKEELQNMAQILAPSTQWQMRISKSSPNATPITSNMWGSLLWKQNKKVSLTSSAKFRVLAIKSDNSTINRLEGLRGTGIDVRSKSRPVEDPSKLPRWNYDGSSTGQAQGDNSEVIYDSYTPQGEPIPSSLQTRDTEIFSNPKVQAEVPCGLPKLLLYCYNTNTPTKGPKIKVYCGEKHGKVAEDLIP